MNLTNFKLDKHNKQLIMGILNVTPDSFYDGGRYSTLNAVILQVEKMLIEGADIIDIGAYSSRPGAGHITEEQEFARLQPVITEIKKHFPQTIISIDTFRSAIAQRIYTEFGTIIINDISGGMMDSQMLEICGKNKLPYICMHMQGTPQTMQQNPIYTNVTQEVYSFLQSQIQKAKECGIETIIIDPGFGFGKTTEQNFELLENLTEFKTLNCPILVGISRKSMIYKTLACTPEESLNGTTILNTIAIIKGANILRVHDVKEAKEVIQLSKNYNIYENTTL